MNWSIAVYQAASLDYSIWLFLISFESLYASRFHWPFKSLVRGLWAGLAEGFLSFPSSSKLMTSPFTPPIFLLFLACPVLVTPSWYSVMFPFISVLTLFFEISIDCVFNMKSRDFCSARQEVGTGNVHFGDICKCLHGVQINIYCATLTSLPSWYTFFGFAFDNIYLVISYLLGIRKGNYWHWDCYCCKRRGGVYITRCCEAKVRGWGMGVE